MENHERSTSRIKVLIVDDDKKLCRLVKDYLEPMGYDVDAAHTGTHGRDQLLDAVAGRSYDVFDRSVDVHISSLRRKLGDDSRNPKFIKTVRSAGYMFIDPRSQEL